MDDAPSPHGAQPVRRIDARSLRALAHPLRMRLLELLELDGPATATGLSEQVGEKTGTVSWHLRHLAEHGFIEEDRQRGTKRERWWTVPDGHQVMNPADFRDDPDARDAVSVFLRGALQLQYSRGTDALAEVWEWDPEWLEAATISGWSDINLTPDQLKALNAELSAVVERHTPAPGTEPEPGALPVVVQIQSFPRRRRAAE